MPDTIDVLDAASVSRTVMTNDKIVSTLGEVQASPTANTLLDRLKTIATASIPAGSAVIGKAGIDQTTPGTTNAVQITPGTSGGWTAGRVAAAASTNATNLKASAGKLGGWALFNNTSSTKFVKLYNKASLPTVGTDTPFMTIIVPASGGANVEFAQGVDMGTGISYAITGAVGDSDATAVALNDVHGFILYK